MRVNAMALVLGLAASASVYADADDGEARFSLSAESAGDAWQRPGFRVGVGFAYGQLAGLGGAPSGSLWGANLRAGMRLDEDWSILTSFQYALARSDGGLTGLRFAGTVDPTWHVTPAFAIALGFGFGGIVESSSTREDAMPYGSQIESSYTFADARTPIAKCSGVGAAGLARAEYSIVLGSRTQATFAIEVVGQWTGCIDDTGRVEPDTGEAIVRRQWWPHAGGTLALGVAWR